MDYSRVCQDLASDVDGLVIDPRSLYARFLRVPDFRKRRGKRYELALLLVMWVLAKLAGENTPAGVTHWVQERRLLFLDAFQLRYPHMPAANTFRRIAGNEGLLKHLEALTRQAFAPEGSATPPTHVALDGKKLRRIAAAEGDQGTWLVAVFAPQSGVVLQQVRVAHRSNEIPAALEAVKGLDLRGKVVTADALHTQRELSAYITGAGGHYVWVAKGNQPNLARDIAQVFAPEVLLPGTSAVITDLASAHTLEKGHGRIERRAITTSRIGAEDYPWPGIQQVFKLTRSTQLLASGETRSEIVYGLTSLPDATPEQLLALLREHWAIENNLHWPRDVLFQEDRLRSDFPILGHWVAALHNLLIAFLHRRGQHSLAIARRFFAAHPDQALRALFDPLP
ncbi:MAG TPA: ISAs1 family transposase [Accumulibacter sp.]|nr:ISAs1 family transposase [Accumulibacter sp.]